MGEQVLLSPVGLGVLVLGRTGWSTRGRVA